MQFQITVVLEGKEGKEKSHSSWQDLSEKIPVKSFAYQKHTIV